MQLDLTAIARSACASFSLQPADRADVEQEAVIGMLSASRLDRSRPVEEQRGYLWRAGRSRALDYLRRQGRRLSREMLVRSEEGEEDATLDAFGARHARGAGGWGTPEELLLGRPDLDTILWTFAEAVDPDDPEVVMDALELGLRRLSSQQAALFRHRLGAEPMREDLERLGAGPRGSVSNVARRKLLLAAEEMGAAKLTAEVLARVFGSKVA